MLIFLVVTTLKSLKLCCVYVMRQGKMRSTKKNIYFTNEPRLARTYWNSAMWKKHSKDYCDHVYYSTILLFLSPYNIISFAFSNILLSYSPLIPHSSFHWGTVLHWINKLCPLNIHLMNPDIFRSKLVDFIHERFHTLLV